MLLAGYRIAILADMYEWEELESDGGRCRSSVIHCNMRGGARTSPWMRIETSIN